MTRTPTTLLAAALLAACSSTPPGAARPPAGDAGTEWRLAGTPLADARTAAEGADALLAGLRMLCGRAYAGRVEVDTPATPDSPFEGKPLVMHVRECGDDVVRVPFHVGDDRSRTWVFTRTPTGLRLKHDHRHADGSPDALTMYGGETARDPLRNDGRLRLEFPVDAESIALFTAEGRAASLTNTWAVEIGQATFVYELARPNGRLFRVVFDLTRPITPPPPPWGASPAP